MIAYILAISLVFQICAIGAHASKITLPGGAWVGSTSRYSFAMQFFDDSTVKISTKTNGLTTCDANTYIHMRRKKTPSFLLLPSYILNFRLGNLRLFYETANSTTVKALSNDVNETFSMTRIASFPPDFECYYAHVDFIASETIGMTGRNYLTWLGPSYGLFIHLDEYAYSYPPKIMVVNETDGYSLIEESSIFNDFIAAPNTNNQYSNFVAYDGFDTYWLISNNQLVSSKGRVIAYPTQIDGVVQVNNNTLIFLSAHRLNIYDLISDSVTLSVEITHYILDDLAISPDKQYIYVLNQEGAIDVYFAANLMYYRTYYLPSSILDEDELTGGIEFTPSGLWIALANFDYDTYRLIRVTLP